MKNNYNNNMTIVIPKELNYTKQVVHNAIAHHTLTGAQTIPEPWCPPVNFPSLYTGRDVIWYGIPLWLIWVNCPCCVPSQLLMYPKPPLAGQCEKLKSP